MESYLSLKDFFLSCYPRFSKDSLSQTIFITFINHFFFEGHFHQPCLSLKDDFYYVHKRMPTNENLIQESWTNDGINLLCFFYSDIDTKFPLFVNDLRQGTCEEYKDGFFSFNRIFLYAGVRN